MPAKKGTKANNAPAKSKNEPTEDAFIVFGDDKKKGKNKGKGQQQEQPLPGEPSKPTARQVIGGASWTGKLPVNLLSEHCQKQKWNKPEYSMRQRPGRDGHDKLYRSEVTLSKKDPKTGQITTLPPFRVPSSLESVSEEPSALEARHFAAAWALFRISSMKSIHMALPPKYRDLWKIDFQQVKKEDESANKGWLYDADPFAAQQKTQEIRVDIAKRQADQEKKAEILAKNPSLALTQGHGGKMWERAPKIEMGSVIRGEIEVLARRHAIWNPHRLTMDQRSRQTVEAELVTKGFRQTHVAEALSICKDRDETLEWLLLHVPEDDLPAFALPAGYSAGVSLASGDIARDSKLKRLNASGYSSELCSEMLRKAEEQEHMAASYLQQTLIPGQLLSSTGKAASPETWEEEMMTLEAIFGDAFKPSGQAECTITLSPENSTTVTLRFIRAAETYPATLPVLLITQSKLPAYIRLSVIKQALAYATKDLLDEPMIYNICQWIEVNLPDIVAHPMPLSDLHMNEVMQAQVDVDQETGSSNRLRKQRRVQGQLSDRRSNEAVLQEWQTRQKSPQQQDMIQARMRLPAWKKQEEILDFIKSHQVTIISGETGSGKSTQVVQFVLDSAISASKGAKTSIVCTQPRRVAALSLADRVSSERCRTVGEEVGYSIRGEAKTSAATKITFMTTGVLLRRIQTTSTIDDALGGITHVFVDEVHERSLDTDFLLALLKDALTTNPQLKLVMMSATLDAEQFMDYFGGAKKVAHAHIEGRTFPVEDLYLDDVLRLTQTQTTEEDAESSFDVGTAIRNSRPGINYDLIRDVVANIDKEIASQNGAILVFLPGTLEIDRCLQALSSLPNIVGLPLHASLLPAEQRKVFPPAPQSKRKVVAATNVAETSITIEDIVAVIDTGRAKETNYDASNNVVRLEEVWASQAACKQRRGRAGRVRAGTCYKLFTKNVETQMSPKPLPEIMRVPLEQLCLSVKATGEDRDVSKFLSSTLTPPNQGAIANAMRTLHIIGALEDDKLTALGTYLASIPADLRCGKLLVYGALFDCVEPCLTIAAIMTGNSPFVSPREKRDEAKAARAAFVTTHGDLINALLAYEQYCLKLEQGLRHRDVQHWCNDNFLSLQTLRDTFSTRGQLLEALKSTGLIPLDYRSPRKPAPSTSLHLLLRALISAALQPQIAAISFPDKKYMQSLTGAKELDPDAKAIKYFAPASSSPASSIANGSGQSTDLTKDERLFVHPSSLLFDFQSFTNSATYISYFQKMATSKTFIRQMTPLNAYSVLLFGGKIYVDTNTGAGLTVGGDAAAKLGGFKIRGWARIGVLVSRLRQMLDEELRDAIDNPARVHHFAKSEVVKVVRRLIELNGQDQ